MNPDTVNENSLLDGRLRLRQPKRGYRAAIDPVLLAAAVPAKSGQKALDLGTGVGTAALCLAVRVAGLAVDGIEIQPVLAALAAENVALNGLGDRVDLRLGDLRRRTRWPSPNTYDHVLANPPYHPTGRGTASPDPGKERANREDETDLAAWIAGARRFLKPGGRLTMIHRADRLDDLLTTVTADFGGIEVVPLWPGGPGGGPAKRVILRAVKGGKSPLTLWPGLILHDGSGGYTIKAEAVLRHGSALPAKIT